MPVTSVDLDADLLARAKELTGASSNRAVIDLALRRLIAFKQKGKMIEGILALKELPEGLGAPTIDYPLPSR
jgi:Arc/MetJ family transcription regulator